MNKFEKWILNQKVWVNILIGLFTYGIWWLIWLFFILKKEFTSKPPTITKVEPTIESKEVSNEDHKQNTIKAPLYEKRFTLEGCDSFQDNIKKIVELEKPNLELYEGMTTKEIKECNYDVYEVEGEETPEVILRENKGKTVHYINVCIYHSGFDRYLTVGRIPEKEQEEILKYFDKNVMLWGSFAGGKYKYYDDESIKTLTEDYSIVLHVKITDK